MENENDMVSFLRHPPSSKGNQRITTTKKDIYRRNTVGFVFDELLSRADNNVDQGIEIYHLSFMCNYLQTNL